MKKLVVLVVVLTTSIVSFGQNWKLDRSHAKIGFAVTHMMLSDTDGSFKDFDATLKSSKSDFTDAEFKLTAKIASISTDNEDRDQHLKSEDFFDVQKYPDLIFKSTSVTRLNGNMYKLVGNMTFHGVTKEVSFDMQLKGTAVDPETKKAVAAFKISGILKRGDFNLANNIGSTMLSEEVAVVANGEFNQM